jgi:hypothetical protein
VLVVVLLALSVSLLWFSQQPAASSSSQQGWKKVSLVTRLTALTATRTYIIHRISMGNQQSSAPKVSTAHS